MHRSVSVFFLFFRWLWINLTNCKYESGEFLFQTFVELTVLLNLWLSICVYAVACFFCFLSASCCSQIWATRGCWRRRLDPVLDRLLCVTRQGHGYEALPGICCQTSFFSCLVSFLVSLVPPWLTRCLNFPHTENQPFSWHEWNLQEGFART